MPVRAPVGARSGTSALPGDRRGATARPFHVHAAEQGEYFGHRAVLDLSPAQVELGAAEDRRCPSARLERLWLELNKMTFWGGCCGIPGWRLRSISHDTSCRST